MLRSLPYTRPSVFLSFPTANARQFLGQLENPKVDYIGGLSPAFAIAQMRAPKNPRSKLGTFSDIYDY